MNGYLEWDSKPALVGKYGLDWPDTREHSGSGRPQIGFVLKGCYLSKEFLGEDLSVLSMARALGRDLEWSLPVHDDRTGREATVISKHIHPRSNAVFWQGNMGSRGDVFVSNAACIASNSRGNISKGTLYNLIDPAVYGRAPSAEGLIDRLEQLDDHYAGKRPRFLELLGLDPEKPTVIHLGRMDRSATDPKGYGIDGVFSEMRAADYNFLFFGSAPDKETISRLREGGASVVTALDVTQLSGQEGRKYMGKFLHGLDKGKGLRIATDFIDGKYEPRKEGALGELVAWPFPVGLLSGESRVAGIHLSRGAHALDSAITQLGLSMPVATLSWVKRLTNEGKTLFYSDGTTEQLPESRLPKLAYIEVNCTDGAFPPPDGVMMTTPVGRMPKAMAKGIAGELEGYLTMPSSEYDSVVAEQERHIGARFGAGATENRLWNIAEAHQGTVRMADRLLDRVKDFFGYD